MHPKLIDYQDTCIGPEGIDLAGLFVDHYHFEGLDSKEIRDVLADLTLHRYLSQ